MDPTYLLVLFPLLAPLLVLYFSKRFNKDNLLTASAFMGGSVLVLSLIILAFTNYTQRDTETLNGFVTTKEIHHFSCPMNTSNPCENGYDCNCHPVPYECGDGKSSRTCYREECDTCYVYPWEQNFFVDSSLQGERAYKISRVDRQGALIPPRWASIRHGDPVSITHSYTNYILSAADSLFAEDGQAEEKYKAKIPAYPQNIYDYYKLDRLVTVGNVKLDRKVWNERISTLLVQVGPRKQANVIVVVAEGVDMDFANAVRRAWKGFKKNDIVVFAGVDAAGNMTWTRTMSWSKASIVNVKMDSDLLERFQGKPLEPIAFTDIVKSESLANFQRRSMEEFKYLKDEASLSTTQIVWLSIITFILTLGITIGFMTLIGIPVPFLPKTGRERNFGGYTPDYFRKRDSISQMQFYRSPTRPSARISRFKP